MKKYLRGILGKIRTAYMLSVAWLRRTKIETSEPDLSVWKVCTDNSRNGTADIWKTAQ